MRSARETFRKLHPFDVTPARARAIQERLHALVISRDELSPVRTVTGIDVGFDDPETARAAIVTLGFPNLAPVETATARRRVAFPYVPGLLSFREIPVVLDALGKLRHLPDLLLCDGQGYAHPRRFGLACHLGVLSGIPAIGVAKSRLIGEYAEPGSNKGDWSPLVDGAEVVGAVLRTRSKVAPLYVSIGHRVCLETAIRYVLACCTRYRLPETTRAAHRLASAVSS
jgi:deoxyribonuclease V